MDSLSKWFWNERIWLPGNYTWNDVRPSENVRLTDFNDLMYPPLIGLGLIVLRFFTEKFVLEKWGMSLGLRHSRGSAAQPLPNPKLDSGFERLVLANGNKKLSFRDIEKLARECGMEVRQVQRWMRRKSNHHRPSRLNKFAESGWRFICYCLLFIGGLVVLVNKPWFWDMQECWIGYPLKHNLENDIWWYYMMSAGFYWSLFISQFYDTKRKDFWQMFIHHLTTIGLLYFSWVGNFTRIGSLIILLHDTADVVLEMGKMAKYSHRDRLCDFFFGLFTILWIITRLGIYPWYILSSTFIEAITFISFFPVYYVFNAMLSVLFVLHIFWTYFIVKVALSAVSKGQYEDARSSSSDEYDDKKNH